MCRVVENYLLSLIVVIVLRKLRKINRKVGKQCKGVVKKCCVVCKKILQQKAGSFNEQLFQIVLYSIPVHCLMLYLHSESTVFQRKQYYHITATNVN